MSNEIELSLASLAEQINTEHDQAVDAIRSGLLHAKRCGDLLSEVKDRLNHGEFMPWLGEHCRFSDRTARAYMRVSKNWEQLEKSATVANLTFRGALNLLTETATVNPHNLELHPYCELFPMMTDSELDALADSIKEHGLIVPIMLYEGKILDGKCRYEACKRAGVAPSFRHFFEEYPLGKSALDYVISMNIHRQSFNESQRAIMACRYIDYARKKKKTTPILAATMDAYQALIDADWAEFTSVGMRVVREPTFEEFDRVGKALLFLTPREH